MSGRKFAFSNMESYPQEFKKAYEIFIGKITDPNNIHVSEPQSNYDIARNFDDKYLEWKSGKSIGGGRRRRRNTKMSKRRTRRHRSTKSRKTRRTKHSRTHSRKHRRHTRKH